MDWEPEQSFNGYRFSWPLALIVVGAASATSAAFAFMFFWYLETPTAQPKALEQIPHSEQSASEPLLEAVVVSVVDGDTVELDFGGRRERVRLLGIDAPESVHPTVPVQCFGPEASAELKAGLPVGSVVGVQRDIEARDRYGRLLLYIYRSADGLFINRWLVRSGLADTSFYEPNTAELVTLTSARTEARAERAGLWGSCDGPDQPLQ